MARTRVSKVDTKTLELIQEVNKQKKEISNAERPNWITSCSFSYTEKPSDAVNIHVESNVRNLVCIVAFLKEKEKSYNEAVQTLGIDAPSFTWGGFTVPNWVSDIQSRINKIQIASKKKKLETLESRLNAIISPELRAKMELEAIAKELE